MVPAQEPQVRSRPSGRRGVSAFGAFATVAAGSKQSGLAIDDVAAAAAALLFGALGDSRLHAAGGAGDDGCSSRAVAALAAQHQQQQLEQQQQHQQQAQPQQPQQPQLQPQLQQPPLQQPKLPELPQPQLQQTETLTESLQGPESTAAKAAKAVAATVAERVGIASCDGGEGKEDAELRPRRRQKATLFQRWSEQVEHLETPGSAGGATTSSSRPAAVVPERSSVTPLQGTSVGALAASELVALVDHRPTSALGALADVLADGRPGDLEVEVGRAGAPDGRPSADLPAMAAEAHIDGDGDGDDSGPVPRWRAAVAVLCAEIDGLPDEEAEDLQELRALLVEEQALDAMGEPLPRHELTTLGQRPVLVTAPHGIYLLRDGWDPHLAEEHTSDVAKALAAELGGCSLTWTTTEQRRAELLVVCSRRRNVDIAEVLDPRNRDPNFLGADELPSNPWFNQVLGAAKSWRLSGASGMLHVDVHGCRNPPATPSHLTIGLGAMHANVKHSGDKRALVVFGAALETELTAVLRELPLQPKATLVRVAGVDVADGAHARFAGAWLPEVERLTQTQQAVSFAGFTHTLQLEMSKVLRRALLRDAKALARFSNALRSAWARSKASA
eukprot:CAMPEP_0177244902 /NCGR_PEP_ID=MMETSP0367-20130122/50164_1 /TAXON_ID=447022 ORGANISM="Scrippsiella hangoei-like, Strain SHHI-4" /NCGR_SAMPLE_ID=MMETSP0367 /ASSEMBLY_ACC=CAM_ASM_000362 /LENGTH=615 /DNA_ID=CAMNT_0018696767 /DNA_START=55 /DNA_END=1902 /DNA_ORIENTATION=-